MKPERIGHFFFNRPRLVWSFQYQLPMAQMDVYVDANWAACKRSRKSTSGGCAIVGSHCIKTWAKTQATVVESSAESELYVAVRRSAEGLGLITMANDFGIELEVIVHMDANAAKGIVERQGLQKTRHIEVDILWLQEMRARRLLPLSKITGEDIPADLMTKNMPIEKVLKFTGVLRLESQEGRAGKAAKLHVVIEATPQDRDRWTRRGEDRVWTIEHTGGRRELCTPCEMRGCPNSGLKLKASRTTTGVTQAGRHLEIHDCWKDPQDAHLQLGFIWSGRTTFLEKHQGDIRLVDELAPDVHKHVRLVGSFISYVKTEYQDWGEYIWDGAFLSDNTGFPESATVTQSYVENLILPTATNASRSSVGKNTIGDANLYNKGVANGFTDKNETTETLEERRSRVAQRWIARAGRAQCVGCAFRDVSKVEEQKR